MPARAQPQTKEGGATEPQTSQRGMPSAVADLSQDIDARPPELLLVAGQLARAAAACLVEEAGQLRPQVGSSFFYVVASRY